MMRRGKCVRIVSAVLLCVAALGVAGCSAAGGSASGGANGGSAVSADAASGESLYLQDVPKVDELLFMTGPEVYSTMQGYGVNAPYPDTWVPEDAVLSSGGVSADADRWEIKFEDASGSLEADDLANGASPYRAYIDITAWDWPVTCAQVAEEILPRFVSVDQVVVLQATAGSEIEAYFASSNCAGFAEFSPDLYDKSRVRGTIWVRSNSSPGYQDFLSNLSKYYGSYNESSNYDGYKK